jgi:tetratricopeptide (TPR) repeat protein
MDKNMEIKKDAKKIIVQGGLKKTLEDYFKTDSNLKKIIFVLWALLILITVWVHYPSLSAEGRVLRDNLYITNSYITNPSQESLMNVFNEVLFFQNFEGFYQPLTKASLMWDVKFGGWIGNLRQFHSTSLYIHLMNVSLLFLLLVVLFRKMKAAFFLSLLFGIHPMSGQLLLRISNRGVLLGSLFGLITILSYISYVKNKKIGVYLFSLFSFALCLFANPLFLMLPLFLLFMDRWPLGIQNKKNTYDRFLVKTPFWIMTIFFGAIGFVSYTNTVALNFYEGVQGLYAFFHNVSFYMVKFFVPFNVSIMLPNPGEFTKENLPVIVGFFITAGFLGLVFWGVQKSKEVYHGMLLFISLFLPFIFFGNLHPTIARLENLYFTNLGLLFLGMFLIHKCWIYVSVKDSIRGKKATFLFGFLAILLISIPVYSTRKEQGHWRDSISVIEYAIKIHGERDYFYYELAQEYKRLDNREKAIYYYQKALEQGGNRGMKEIGILLVELGEDEEAATYLLRALNNEDLARDEKDEVIQRLMDLQKYDELLQYWEEEKAKEGADIFILDRLLSLYILTKDDEKTLETAVSILTMNRQDLHWEYELELLRIASRLYMNVGDLKSARVYSERGLRMDTSDEELQNISMEATIILDRMDRLEYEDRAYEE